MTTLCFGYLRLWSSLGNILLIVLSPRVTFKPSPSLVSPAGCPCSSDAVRTFQSVPFCYIKHFCGPQEDVQMWNPCHQPLDCRGFSCLALCRFESKLGITGQKSVGWQVIFLAYQMMFDFCQGDIPLVCTAPHSSVCMSVCMCVWWGGTSVCICVWFQENRKIKATEMMEVRAPFHAYNHNGGPIGRVKLSRASVCLFSRFQTTHTQTHTRADWLRYRRNYPRRPPLPCLPVHLAVWWCLTRSWQRIDFTSSRRVSRPPGGIH